MLTVEVISNAVFDGMIIEINEDSDQQTTCYTFDRFVNNLIECSEGTILQRWNDVVLFRIPELDRVYGVCKDEYIKLVLRDHVEIQAFTKEEYNQFLKAVAQFGETETDYVN